MARRTLAGGALVALAALLAWARGGATQQPPRQPAAQPGAKVTPKLEPVAETRLLMEGLAHANFRGIERLLREKPAEVQAWTFIRGQALLIAETGNLLMLRPPRSQGQPVWFDRATELRKSAGELARTAGAQNYAQSRAAFVSLANTCNRCHQSFRVPVEITPFADPKPGPKAGL
jgi:hypothetical protein